MVLHKDQGAISIEMTRTTTIKEDGFSSKIINMIHRSWSLVAHSLDNHILLSKSDRVALRPRNLDWLRERLNHESGLDIVRILPDGSRASARGSKAVALMDGHGFAIFQVRDGAELVTIRSVRP